MTRAIAAFLVCLTMPLASPAAEPAYRLTVVHYDLRLRLDIAEESVSGELVATARGFGAGSESLVLDVGDLAIDSVTLGRERLAFAVADHRLSVRLPRVLSQGRSARVTVTYHGQPKRGLRFFKDRQQAYTVFSTSQWMPAVDAPDHKATLRLRLSVPDGLVAVASGKQVGRRTQPERRVEHEWVQDEPLPSYVFGFAVGPFRRVVEAHRGVRLEYLGASFTDAELRQVFELAHQWWGNSVTCRDWNHFWLNEGMATFLADAYLERRLGAEAYARQIAGVRADHERVRDKGGDKPLVFPDWLRPSAADRVIVYRKGAYVLHLLRESLGDALFWAGLRDYTRRHMGRSVTTADFQLAIEKRTGRDLDAFFEHWVYTAAAP